MKNQTKAATVVGSAGVILPYLASLVAAKYHIPLEVAAAALGGVFTFLGRWAGKLMPH